MSGPYRLLLSRVAALWTAFLLCAAISAAANHKKKLPAKPLDLNTATLKQLEQLPGIGPSTAQAIIQFREKSGPFQRVEDLLAVRRISASRFEKLRPYITVAKARPPNRH
ncbi:MAG TPA: helix-hairpin-helix domain-containing protein [Candidatus Acidoferrum sp.]|nr:helix-hairpin-helix domain-containing protein [Candidatus Acidoferrum sp.]